MTGSPFSETFTTGAVAAALDVQRQSVVDFWRRAMGESSDGWRRLTFADAVMVALSLRMRRLGAASSAMVAVRSGRGAIGEFVGLLAKAQHADWQRALEADAPIFCSAIRYSADADGDEAAATSFLVPAAKLPTLLAADGHDALICVALLPIIRRLAERLTEGAE
jgi:hypothetical protein